MRPGERSMLAYCRYMIDIAQFIQDGDMLIFDGEKSFTTDAVQNFLSSRGVMPFVFRPSCLHQFLNPCDNNFHSLFKMSYYRLISHENFRQISVQVQFIIHVRKNTNIPIKKVRKNWKWPSPAMRPLVNFMWSECF
jgi:hypothetical protein